MTERILVTGISGFIAKHVALQLLNRGYEVRGTLRALNKAEQVKRSLSEAGAEIGKLSFAAADLSKDDGWEEACADCQGIMHIASPLPISQPRDRMALVPAARGGVLRVLSAGQKADRIVMTSSIAAMIYRPSRPAEITIDESDWTDPDWKKLSPYMVSKTLAEKAAWYTATEGGYRHRMTTINPGLVVGPALDDDIGASVELIRLMIKGEYPAVPPISFPTVDVRDVAALHVSAFERPETGGRRLIAAGETASLLKIAQIIREAAPALATKLPKRELPALLVRIAAKFDTRLTSIIADLGTIPHADTGYVSDLTGVTFRNAREAVGANVASLQKIKSV